MKKNNFEAKIWAKGAKIGPEARFFLPFSQVWFFTLKLYAMIAYNNVYYLVEIKATKKIWGEWGGGGGDQI